MKYQVGENVVHLSHGVGVIKGIERREFSPEKVAEFYILEIQDNGAPKKVFVPIGSEKERLRPIVKQKDIDQIYSILKNTESEPIDHQTWNRRYREYMERIHTGNAMEIATVLKSLISLKDDKDLSFGERKLLDCAFDLLVRELSIAECLPEETIVNKIRAIVMPERANTLSVIQGGKQ